MVHVVELKTLYLCAVDQRGMRRRQFLARAPYHGRLRRIELAQALLQDATPFEIGAEQSATERIENQHFDARDDFAGDGLIAQSGNKLRNATGIRVVGGRLLSHSCAPGDVEMNPRCIAKVCARSSDETCRESDDDGCLAGDQSSGLYRRVRYRCNAIAGPSRKKPGNERSFHGMAPLPSR